MYGFDPQIFSFFFLLLVAFGTAYYAYRINRNPFLWFFIGALIGIFAPLVLYFVSVYSNDPKVENEEKSSAISTTPEPLVIPPKPETAIGVLEENKLWYYLDADHQQMGPISIIGLRELWNTGKLDLKSYVWSSGMKEWKRVEDLNDLRSMLNSTQI
ncbi:MAG: DUF4339 domain-containing protein [Parachlamydiaceae bacterium]|nr:DUF4339 domain-containing protein [Parachlamydiaceae bacterium]